MKNVDRAALDWWLEQIAKKHLGLNTLERQGSDDLDFHELAVWSIGDALEAAYNAGRKSGLAEAATFMEKNRNSELCGKEIRALESDETRAAIGWGPKR